MNNMRSFLAKKNCSAFASLFLASSLSISFPAIFFEALPQGIQSASAQEQGEHPSVSVVSLQVVDNGSGAQQVVLPRGYMAPLPGGGVDGNVVQIYIGSAGGYWYVDRNGQTVDLTSYAQRMMASRQSAANIPANAPVYAPTNEQSSVNQNQSNQNQSNQGQSSQGSGIQTAAMAGVGAMAGTALVNSLYYHNVPYGTPMYYGGGGNPYYVGPNGNTVYAEGNHDLSPNQKAYMYNQHQIKMQQQQEWYQNHQQNKTAAYQSWQSQNAQSASQSSANHGAAAGGMQNNMQNNPFVHENYARAGSVNAGAAEAASQGGRRFGRRNADVGEAEAEAGSRFAGQQEGQRRGLRNQQERGSFAGARGGRGALGAHGDGNALGGRRRGR